jgi:hypothetical protein
MWVCAKRLEKGRFQMAEIDRQQQLRFHAI